MLTYKIFYRTSEGTFFTLVEASSLEDAKSIAIRDLKKIGINPIEIWN